MKMTYAGDTLWTSEINGSWEDFTVTEMHNGSIAVTGSPEFYMIILDSTGVFQTAWNYGGPQTDALQGACLLNDGGMILTGNTHSFGTSQLTVNSYIVKTNSSGVSGCNETSIIPILPDYNCNIGSRGIERISKPTTTYNHSPLDYWPPQVIANICGGVNIEDITTRHLSLHPNPASSFVEINFNVIPDNKAMKISVVDVVGKIVYTKKEYVSEHYKLDISDLPGGLYIINCNNEHQTYSGKLIVVE
jgi:hypothetical protein